MDKYKDKTLDIDVRVNDLLSKMTLKEKSRPVKSKDVWLERL